MNEASVSSPFMSELRKRLDAEVIKHHDASMIGLPDCSVHFCGRSHWLEFKLTVYKKWMVDMTYDTIALNLWAEIVSRKKKAQHEMMLRLKRRAATALYVFWVKKDSVMFVDPLDGKMLRRCENTQEAVDWYADYLLSH